MVLTKKGAVFFDVNTTRDSNHTITAIGAVHCGSNKIFEMKVSQVEGLKMVLQAFLDWLLTLNDGKAVGLIAHNCFAFDRHKLENSASSVGLQLPSSIISAYYDSMLAFKDHLKLKKNPSVDEIAGNEVPRKDHGTLNDSKLIKDCTLKTLQAANMRIQKFFENHCHENQIN